MKGSYLAGDYGVQDWNTIASPYIFADLYKHCTPLYLRSTNNGGATYTWKSNADVMWDSLGTFFFLFYSKIEYL